MEPQEKKISRIIFPIIIFFMGCGVMYGLIYTFPNLFKTIETRIEKDVTVTDTGIADSVEKVYDAVVIVSTYQNNQLYSTGTGFVYEVKGDTAYILTNNHVIENGSKVTATFTSGEVVECEVVNEPNELADIAVLSVPKSKIISVAEIGDSEAVRVGDTTFAVGAPLDSVYSWTVTRGILSGKDRMVEVEISQTSGDYVMKVLQTDAAINSGNSGGPLCNSNGEIIGITSLKLVDESVEGMGFAIPIEIALEYASKIVAGEKITQPFLGVQMLNVYDAYYSPQYARILAEAEITSGVIITAVEKNSPAAKAGLAAGDVVTKINDDSVSSIGYLRYYLYTYEVNDTILITFIRDGKEKTATVTLGSSTITY